MRSLFALLRSQGSEARQRGSTPHCLLWGQEQQAASLLHWSKTLLLWKQGPALCPDDVQRTARTSEVLHLCRSGSTLHVQL